MYLSVKVVHIIVFRNFEFRDNRFKKFSILFEDANKIVQCFVR